jgi:hypothetical protein
LLLYTFQCHCNEAISTAEASSKFFQGSPVLHRGDGRHGKPAMLRLQWDNQNPTIAILTIDESGLASEQKTSFFAKETTVRQIN